MEELWQIYLPVAGIKLNVCILLTIGIFAGLLAGMFGLGGGLVVVPILMAIGIDPKVAVASATNQMTAASFSSYLAYARKGRVDYKLAVVMLTGGLPGAFIGILLFYFLAEIGKLDVVVSLCFIALLSIVGCVTMFDALLMAFSKIKRHPWTHNRRIFTLPSTLHLPIRLRFDSGANSISIFSPVLIGLVAGILMALMGIGGSLIMIPAMVYILNISHSYTAGTVHLQIIFTTILTTLLHALTSHNIDILLSSILILGTAFGAQIGAKLASKIHPEYFQIIMALIIFGICVMIMRGLLEEPAMLYTVEWVR
ncbi:MAG: sulfite exporter TauE/SafE family protein [Proteobacteria bacterium]|nr:sulfite exporter TauE/SafE family protein [Pseudomonadota bacterium]